MRVSIGGQHQMAGSDSASGFLLTRLKEEELWAERGERRRMELVCVIVRLEQMREDCRRFPRLERLPVGKGRRGAVRIDREVLRLLELCKGERLDGDRGVAKIQQHLHDRRRYRPRNVAQLRARLAIATAPRLGHGKFGYETAIQVYPTL